MKLAKHKDFDSFLEAILPTEQAICVRLRGLVLGNFPELKEKFAYGAPFYHRNSRVCFLYPASLPYSGIPSGVAFGFNQALIDKLACAVNIHGIFKNYRDLRQPIAG